MSSCPTNTCGIGGPGSPLPGDPDSSNVTLHATPAFGGIDITWTYPAINPSAVAHVRLYRSGSADFGGAILLQIVNGTFYYDKVDANIQYWYWIEVVSVQGTIGDLIGPASASARPLIEDLIEQLTSKIDSGMLAIALKGRLDQISLLNENLLDEITARENSEISLGDAIAAAQAGNAQALTFIANEQASRATADSAIAESIDVVAATLGDNFAAVTTAMQVAIDDTKGTVDAMYTAKVNVNGLVGGFGIHNDGASVDAGFDTDTFWVGRTAANKRKPFIIVGGETFIDEAVINHLTFSKLRDEAGTFIVADGKVKAAYIEIANAMITNAMIADAQITNAKIGDGQITTAKIGDAQIDTLKVAGQAITIPAGNSSGSNTCTVPFTVPGTETLNIYIAGNVFIFKTISEIGQVSLSIDGIGEILHGAGVGGTTVSLGKLVSLGPGSYTFRIASDSPTAGSGSSIFALATRR